MCEGEEEDTQKDLLTLIRERKQREMKATEVTFLFLIYSITIFEGKTMNNAVDLKDFTNGF